MLRFFVATGLACAWIMACSAEVDEPPYTSPTTSGPATTTTSTTSGEGSSGGGVDSGGAVDAGDPDDDAEGGNDEQGDDDTDSEGDGGAEDSGDTSSTSSTSTTSTTGGDGTCGDGMVSNREQCDGSNLNGYDCTSLGYTGGTLGCDPVMCTFDTSMCSNDDGGTSGG